MICPVDALTFLESSIAATAVPQHRADADAEQNSAEYDGQKLRACHRRDELAHFEKARESGHSYNGAKKKSFAQRFISDEEKRDVYYDDKYTQPYAGQVAYHHAHARHAAVEYSVRNKKALDGKRGARRADDYHDNREELLFEKALHCFTLLIYIKIAI